LNLQARYRSQQIRIVSTDGFGNLAIRKAFVMCTVRRHGVVPAARNNLLPSYSISPPKTNKPRSRPTDVVYGYHYGTSKFEEVMIWNKKHERSCWVLSS